MLSENRGSRMTGKLSLQEVAVVGYFQDFPNPPIQQNITAVENWNLNMRGALPQTRNAGAATIKAPRKRTQFIETAT